MSSQLISSPNRVLRSEPVPCPAPKAVIAKAERLSLLPEQPQAVASKTGTLPATLRPASCSPLRSRVPQAIAATLQSSHRANLINGIHLGCAKACITNHKQWHRVGWSTSIACCRLTNACSRPTSQSSNLHAQICRLSGGRLMRGVRRHWQHRAIDQKEYAHSIRTGDRTWLRSGLGE